MGLPNGGRGRGSETYKAFKITTIRDELEIKALKGHDNKKGVHTFKAS